MEKDPRNLLMENRPILAKNADFTSGFHTPKYKK